MKACKKQELDMLPYLASVLTSDSILHISFAKFLT